MKFRVWCTKRVFLCTKSTMNIKRCTKTADLFTKYLFGATRPKGFRGILSPVKLLPHRRCEIVNLCSRQHQIFYSVPILTKKETSPFGLVSFFYILACSSRKSLRERGRSRPRERLPKERSPVGWMERSGTLSEASDNVRRYCCFSRNSFLISSALA